MIPAPSHLLIENIAVRPDAQGRGLGGRLVAHAEDVARSLGLRDVRLYTNARFESNIAFYARRGFEETRRDQVPVGVVVYMQKAIPAP